MKNTGTHYEALTEQVFIRLLAQESVCAKIERDVVFEGRSTRHQVDVTFEFVAGAVNYRTIVQCKDWGTPVKQEQVLAFHSVLADIPGQPRGIMVSRSGFQAGARRVAEHHGIKLYELREPRDEDWNGLIRAIVTTVIIREPRFDDVRLVIDDGWVREQGLQRERLVREHDPRELSVIFASGAPCDLDAILNSYVSHSGSEAIRVRHEFDEPAFLESNYLPVARVPVLGIEALVSIREHRQIVRVSLDHLIAYCFLDVLGGSVRFLGRDGATVREKQ